MAENDAPQDLAIPLTYQEYSEQYPNDLALFRNSRIFQALMHSLGLEYQRALTATSRATVKNEEGMCDFNFDQGSLFTVERLITMIGDPLGELQPTEKEEPQDED